MSRLAIVALAALSACGGDSAREQPAEPVRSSDTEPSRPELTLATRAEPISPEAKIFLFAGSSRNANFAHEVIEQRRLWREAGFSDRDIVCYYVVPYREEVEDDYEQWAELAPALADCYPASVALLFEHLAGTAGGPFLYLYVTAHGERPIGQILADTDPGEDSYHGLVRRSKHAVLDQYRVIVEALPDGTAGEAEILGAYRAGVDPRRLYLTPAYLAEVLARHYRDVPKYVAIQGCFSGGFVEEPDRVAPLPALPAITVLTASRYDRESFGCNAGERATFYGGAYLRALRARAADPRAIDWADFHREVARRVDELEREIDAFASHPAYFSSQAE